VYTVHIVNNSGLLSDENNSRSSSYNEHAGLKVNSKHNCKYFAP